MMKLQSLIVKYEKLYEIGLKFYKTGKWKG